LDSGVFAAHFVLMFLVFRALLGAPYVGPVTSNFGLKTVLQFLKNDRLYGQRPDRKLDALMASHCAGHCGDLLEYEQRGARD
jgi:hypothetical protein